MSRPRLASETARLACRPYPSCPHPPGNGEDSIGWFASPSRMPRRSRKPTARRQASSVSPRSETAPWWSVRWWRRRAARHARTRSGSRSVHDADRHGVGTGLAGEVAPAAVAAIDRHVATACGGRQLHARYWPEAASCRASSWVTAVTPRAIAGWAARRWCRRSRSGTRPRPAAAVVGQRRKRGPRRQGRQEYEQQQPGPSRQRRCDHRQPPPIRQPSGWSIARATVAAKRPSTLTERVLSAMSRRRGGDDDRSSSDHAGRREPERCWPPGSSGRCCRRASRR